MPHHPLRLVALVAAFVALLTLVSSATADNGGGGQTIVAVAIIKAGPLWLHQPKHIVLRPGQPLTVNMTIGDARGSGAGWDLRLSDVPQAPIMTVTVGCLNGNQCFLPKRPGEPGGRQVIHAAPKSGMGGMWVRVVFAAPPADADPQPLRFLLRRKG